LAKTQKESLLQKKLRMSLQFLLPGQFVYSLKIHGDRYSAPGVPDIIACIHGTFVAIECKMWRGRPTEAQQLHLRDIIRAGGIGLYCVWNKEEDEYYWVKADSPFTYRAKGTWIKAGEKTVTREGRSFNIIDCTFLSSLLLIKLFGLKNADQS